MGARGLPRAVQEIVLKIQQVPKWLSLDGALFRHLETPLSRLNTQSSAAALRGQLFFGSRTFFAGFPVSARPGSGLLQVSRCGASRLSWQRDRPTRAFRRARRFAQATDVRQGASSSWAGEPIHKLQRPGHEWRKNRVKQYFDASQCRVTYPSWNPA
ncbi:hypothetical protein VTI74DRAFT_8570 [Chaetomium olivicolor]